MDVRWVAETVVGSAITWAVFTGMAALWAKRKLLPIWREHKALLMAAVAVRESSEPSAPATESSAERGSR